MACISRLPGAVERYDPSLGAPFKAYLITLFNLELKQAQRVDVGQKGLKRLDYEKLERVLKIEDKKEQDIALDALARGGSRAKTKTISAKEQAKARFPLAPHLIVNGQIVTTPNSLDALLNTTDDHGDVTVNNYEPAVACDAEHQVYQNIESDRLRNDMQILTPRERFILTLYHGLFGAPELPLKRIGQLVDPPITESRVSQLRSQSIKKLVAHWNEPGRITPFAEA